LVICEFAITCSLTNAQRGADSGFSNTLTKAGLQKKF